MNRESFAHLSPLPRFLFAITSKSSLLLVKNHHYFDHFIYMVIWYYGIYTYNIQYSNFSLQNWGVVFLHTIPTGNQNWMIGLSPSCLEMYCWTSWTSFPSLSQLHHQGDRQLFVTNSVTEYRNRKRGESSTLSVVLLWALRGLKI